MCCPCFQQVNNDSPKRGILTSHLRHSFSSSSQWRVVILTPVSTPSDWNFPLTLDAHGRCCVKPVFRHKVIVEISTKEVYFIRNSFKTGQESPFPCQKKLCTTICLKHSKQQLFCNPFTGFCRSESTRFRWFQDEGFSDRNIWAIDSVFLGDECPWLCQGHGSCGDDGNCM